MSHPYASQAKASLKSRLSKLGGHAGKAHGSTNMYKETSYPKKNAGSETAMTLKGKPAKPKSGYFAIGGMVGKKGAGKKKHGQTTNVNVIVPPKPEAVPAPVLAPAAAGGPPVGALPPRPPMAGPPPGLAPRPPGLKRGGAVKKAMPFTGKGNGPASELKKEEKAGSSTSLFMRGGSIPMPKLTGGGDSGVGRLEKSKAVFKGASS